MDLIPLDPRERLLQKAHFYAESIDAFLKDRAVAVPVLLRALKYADVELKRKTMVLLGTFAREQAAWPLYEILTDPHEDPDTREAAALQLSIVFPFLRDAGPLMGRLLDDLGSPDSRLRLYAASAIGWQGNSRAAVPLIERLFDPDTQVQHAALKALFNLCDDRLFGLLADRLEHGPPEHRSCILFNLRRFAFRRDEVLRVYLRYLEEQDDDLRRDALVLLGTVSETQDHMTVYERCLADKDPRIRLLALKRLAEIDSAQLKARKAMFEAMLDDPQVEIKQVAVRLLKRI